MITENIAFSDSLVHPQYRPAPVFDSALFKKLIRPKMRSDSVGLIADSLHKMADSLADQKINDHPLYLFQPKDTIPKMLEAKLISKNVLQFVFNFPADTVKIISEKYVPEKQWYKAEWNAENDTLLWFLKEPHPDSLKLLVMDGKDTLGLRDLEIKKQEKKSFFKRKKKEPKKIEYLGWKGNMTNIIKPGQKLEIKFDQPVGRLRFDSVLLVNEKDSIYDPPHYFADSIHRTLVIPFKVEPDKHYKLSVPDSAVYDWNGYFNKSFVISLQSKKTKEYGVLRFKLNPGKKQHYIFQMLDGKKNVITSRYFSTAKDIEIKNVDPGTYGFRIIFDTNNNKKWDTGNYLDHLEPEKVIYYPKQIKVRANWEIDESWSF